MNPLYNQRQQSQSQMNNINSFLQQYSQFRQNFQGVNPQQIVEGLVSSGRITQQQLDQYKNTAAQIQKVFS